MTQQNMPQPPRMGRQNGLAPSVKGAPENVRLGVRAWYTVAVLQALTAVLQMILNFHDRSAVVQQVKKQTEGVDLPSGITQDMLVTGTIITGLFRMVAEEGGALLVPSPPPAVFHLSSAGFPRRCLRWGFLLTLGVVTRALLSCSFHPPPSQPRHSRSCQDASDMP